VTKYEHLAAGAPVRIRRTIPSRAPTVEADFAVPALTGLLVGLLGAVLPAVLFWLLWGLFWIPYASFGSVFCLVGLSWRVLVGDKSLWASESIESTGLDPSGGLQMPALPERAPVLLNPYAGRETLEAERREEKRSGFAAFVRACERDTTSRRWETEVGRTQYATWRDLLLSSGWASWRSDNPRDGWELSADPDTIIGALG